MRFAGILNQLASVVKTFTVEANNLLRGAVALELKRNVVLGNVSW